MLRTITEYIGGQNDWTGTLFMPIELESVGGMGSHWALFFHYHRDFGVTDYALGGYLFTFPSLDIRGLEDDIRESFRQNVGQDFDVQTVQLDWGQVELNNSGFLVVHLIGLIKEIVSEYFEREINGCSFSYLSEVVFQEFFQGYCSLQARVMHTLINVNPDVEEVRLQLEMELNDLNRAAVIARHPEEVEREFISLWEQAQELGLNSTDNIEETLPLRLGSVGECLVDL